MPRLNLTNSWRQYDYESVYVCMYCYVDIWLLIYLPYWTKSIRATKWVFWFSIYSNSIEILPKVFCCKTSTSRSSNNHLSDFMILQYSYIITSIIMRIFFRSVSGIFRLLVYVKSNSLDSTLNTSQKSII